MNDENFVSASMPPTDIAKPKRIAILEAAAVLRAVHENLLMISPMVGADLTKQVGQALDGLQSAWGIETTISQE